MSVADLVALHGESMRQYRRILEAIEANTAAIERNTQAMRELLAAPVQRIGGGEGMPSGEAMGQGKVVRK